ncbi:hypothetical protein NIES2135_22840 [Leptolyngbya boryana NIES-2135]|jgi:hypothetical protein|uniref:DUF2949 domain-containing protein n=2 Tax=Leptolyngbya boryana TaxID=1184 RepID=A0A1Z4JFE6_LEPBY|nr:Protein of unknown function (DUF2949) [Leptolyngbya boryana IAM M-101]BAS64676.1 Protein of unknown function (DUF2949) [Leptolyngbya boryana dg5]BAY55461.1 hypothetical protein NIES2135_22840 [Leptolyngbya boryana NIES-2135]
MGSCTMEAKRSKLIEFLKTELALPNSAIDLAVRHSQIDTEPLPMILWQYGLVTLNQLDQIFDWLEKA